MQWLIGSWTNEDNTYKQTYQWRLNRTQILTIIEKKNAGKWENIIEANFIYHPIKERLLAYATASTPELSFFELMVMKTDNGLELYSESINSINRKVSSVSYWHNISADEFAVFPIDVTKDPVLPWLYGAWHKVNSN